MAFQAVDFAIAKKANRPVVLDLRALTAMTDYFVIVSASNSRQAETIADYIYDSFKNEQALLPSAKERDEDGRWILLDYGDIVVHIFREDAREYYDLERLWSDAEIIEVM